MAAACRVVAQSPLLGAITDKPTERNDGSIRINTRNWLNCSGNICQRVRRQALRLVEAKLSLSPYLRLPSTALGI
jgi:hypothetical protein